MSTGFWILDSDRGDRSLHMLGHTGCVMAACATTAQRERHGDRDWGVGSAASDVNAARDSLAAADAAGFRDTGAGLACGGCVASAALCASAIAAAGKANAV